MIIKTASNLDGSGFLLLAITAAPDRFVMVLLISFHHYQANMELSHLFTRSGLTHQEVSLMVSPGCLLPVGL